MIALRAVGGEAFDAVLPLLQLLGSRSMTTGDWKEMLFDHDWAPGEPRGFAILADDRMVGFLGTIFSRRPVRGRSERICSFSSWIVEPEHRGATVLLMRQMLRQLDGCTIVGQTPVPTTVEVFRRLGFQTLETEQLWIPPVASPADLARSASGRFTLDPEGIRRAIGGEEARIFQDLQGRGSLRFAWIRSRGRSCLVAARPDRRKRVRVADILYASDWEVFWSHRWLVHAAFLRAMGAPALLVDSRFAPPGGVGAALRVPRIRLFRPSRPEIAPADLDNLYSELMSLRG